MMITPIVSVICTVYKHRRYLRQCLDGFVMQKVSFPFEVLVNDDCSPDNSADIIREYENEYPGLFHCVFQSENQYSKGVSPLTEILLPMAKGAYIALCEGDDYWTDPYKLQKQVDFMDNNPDYIACFHNTRIQYKDGIALFNSLDENHDPSTEDIIKRRWFISTPSLLFRNVLHSFPKWKKDVVNEDFMLELMLARDGKFHYLDDVMAVYRQEGTGISASLNANGTRMMDLLISLLNNMKSYYGGGLNQVFDEAIHNYELQRDGYVREAYFQNHLLARLFRPKTYTRLLKKQIRKWLM